MSYSITVTKRKEKSTDDDTNIEEKSPKSSKSDKKISVEDLETQIWETSIINSMESNDPKKSQFKIMSKTIEHKDDNMLLVTYHVYMSYTKNESVVSKRILRINFVFFNDYKSIKIGLPSHFGETFTKEPDYTFPLASMRNDSNLDLLMKLVMKRFRLFSVDNTTDTFKYSQVDYHFASFLEDPTSFFDLFYDMLLCHTTVVNKLVLDEQSKSEKVEDNEKSDDRKI